MKIAFATCVQLGKSCIEKTYEIGGSFDLLITLKDECAKNKSGRIYLDDIAEKYDVPLLKIENINEASVISNLREKQIDWLFIIGWSQIARKELLGAPKKGCLGMHPTLLPEGRGRAAIPWAILKGLKKTGVTLFRLDEGVDTGDIAGQIEIPLSPDITANKLYEEVTKAHVLLMEQCWKDLQQDTLTFHRQDESMATVWPGRKPEDGEIRPDMNAEEAEHMVRAVTHPYPGAFYWQDGKKYILWSAKIAKEKEGFSFPLKDGWLIPIDYEIAEG